MIFMLFISQAVLSDKRGLFFFPLVSLDSDSTCFIAYIGKKINAKAYNIYVNYFNGSGWRSFTSLSQSDTAHALNHFIGYSGYGKAIVSYVNYRERKIKIKKINASGSILKEAEIKNLLPKAQPLMVSDGSGCVIAVKKSDNTIALFKCDSNLNIVKSSTFSIGQKNAINGIRRLKFLKAENNYYLFFYHYSTAYKNYKAKLSYITLDSLCDSVASGVIFEDERARATFLRNYACLPYNNDFYLFGVKENYRKVSDTVYKNVFPQSYNMYFLSSSKALLRLPNNRTKVVASINNTNSLNVDKFHPFIFKPAIARGEKLCLVYLYRDSASSNYYIKFSLMSLSGMYIKNGSLDNFSEIAHNPQVVPFNNGFLVVWQSISPYDSTKSVYRYAFINDDGTVDEGADYLINEYNAGYHGSFLLVGLKDKAFIIGSVNENNNWVIKSYTINP